MKPALQSLLTAQRCPRAPTVWQAWRALEATPPSNDGSRPRAAGNQRKKLNASQQLLSTLARDRIPSPHPGGSFRSPHRSTGPNDSAMPLPSSRNTKVQFLFRRSTRNMHVRRHFALVKKYLLLPDVDLGEKLRSRSKNVEFRSDLLKETFIQRRVTPSHGEDRSLRSGSPSRLRDHFSV
jgi:hypothetical protein